MGIKVSTLGAATTPLAGTEELAVVQGGVTKKTIASELNVGNLWVVSKSSSQTLGNNTVDPITFDTANVDGGGSVIDLVNNRFVSPDNGLYVALVHWLWEDTAPANAGYASARVNGADVASLVGVIGTPVSFQRLNGTFPFSLSSGDLVTMVVNPGAVSGVTARGNASAHLRTSFSLIRIA